MATKGLYIPLSVIVGDSLSVAFDITFEGEKVDPDDITLEGQIVRSADDMYPESFSFEVAEDDSYKVYAKLDSDTTEGLEVGEYTYQIRFTHDTDLSTSTDTTGDKTTILYGSLTVLSSPMFI